MLSAALWRVPKGEELKLPVNDHMKELRSRPPSPFRDFSPG